MGNNLERIKNLGIKDNHGPPSENWDHCPYRDCRHNLGAEARIHDIDLKITTESGEDIPTLAKIRMICSECHRKFWTLMDSTIAGELKEYATTDPESPMYNSRGKGSDDGFEDMAPDYPGGPNALGRRNLSDIEWD